MSFGTLWLIVTAIVGFYYGWLFRELRAQLRGEDFRDWFKWPTKNASKNFRTA